MPQSKFIEDPLSDNPYRKHIKQYSWPQIVSFLTLVAVGIPRCVQSINTENGPGRLPTIKKRMVCVLIFGICQSIFGMVSMFVFKPESETRFLLVSISQFVTMVLVGLFAFEYLFTCILHYDYLAIPAAISAVVLAVVLKNYAERCYYGLYIAWSIQLFSGVLELYLVLNNRIMDGMFHEESQ
ncbi:hypothetical protein GCK72_008876 [Caenorhabditis remanei]|uniref:Uncharacterized protein n=1 Tax=Caenorhabditis remanei TaxID=31234 RepID=A0A6A5GZW7_CAERE|nr:hypothetical protein GCK72_008876 [Caenorhabditis remanei]KAF1760627.1 hypothetical protein GCK72_008876 [Caenorhabditis remanei]